MSSLISAIEKKSKKQIAYERIKEEIIRNKLKPGALLIERQLCEALDTSRTPVREALQQLTSEGLVNFISGKGAFVSNVTYKDFIEIYTVREVLEGLACRLCTLLIVDEQIKLLENIYSDLKKSVDLKKSELFITGDVEFHRLIIENAQNNVLQNMMNIMQSQIQRITYYIEEDEERIIQSLEQHEIILKAIKDREEEKAEKAMREHIRDSKNYHIKKIERFKGFYTNL